MQCSGREFIIVLPRATVMKRTIDTREERRRSTCSRTRAEQQKGEKAQGSHPTTSHTSLLGTVSPSNTKRPSWGSTNHPLSVHWCSAIAVYSAAKYNVSTNIIVIESFLNLRSSEESFELLKYQISIWGNSKMISIRSIK